MIAKEKKKKKGIDLPIKDRDFYRAMQKAARARYCYGKSSVCPSVCLFVRDAGVFHFISQNTSYIKTMKTKRSKSVP